jgi:hypothetical protein
MTEPDSPTSSLDGRILNKKIIELPPSSGLVLESELTREKLINGQTGGWFEEEFWYETSNGQVDIDSDLHFFQNSFSGTVNITQTFNTETAAIVFGPAMQFNVPVDYTLEIVGVDLTGINPNTLDFVYIDANGNMYACDKESVTMNLNTSTLKVTKAKLNHFSRYGFVN